MGPGALGYPICLTIPLNCLTPSGIPPAPAGRLCSWEWMQWGEHFNLSAECLLSGESDVASNQERTPSQVAWTLPSPPLNTEPLYPGSLVKHQNSSEKTESVRDTHGLFLIFITHAIWSDSHTEALTAY